MSLVDVFFKDLFVIQQLALRDKCRENAATNLGQLWQILNPFINMMIFVMLFTTVFKMDDFVNYPVYICTGTIIYEYFVQGTNGAMLSLASNKVFLLNTSLKKDIFVFEKVYVSLINLLFSFFIYIGLMVFYRIPFKIYFFCFFVDIFIFTFLVLGIGKILAVINVYFADINYFYSIFTLFIFYGTAIFYSADRLTPSLQKIMSYNPIYIAITIARISLLDGKGAPLHLWLKLIIYSSFFSVVGTWVFKKGTNDIVSKL